MRALEKKKANKDVVEGGGFLLQPKIKKPHQKRAKKKVPNLPNGGGRKVRFAQRGTGQPKAVPDVLIAPKKGCQGKDGNLHAK